MNKHTLAERIANKLNISRKSAMRFLHAFEEEVITALEQTEEVTMAGFGTFFPTERKGRLGVHPRTPTMAISIPTVRVAKFRPGKHLKEALKFRGENRTTE